MMRMVRNYPLTSPCWPFLAGHLFIVNALRNIALGACRHRSAGESGVQLGDPDVTGEAGFLVLDDVAMESPVAGSPG